MAFSTFLPHCRLPAPIHLVTTGSLWWRLMYFFNLYLRMTLCLIRGSMMLRRCSDLYRSSKTWPETGTTQGVNQRKTRRHLDFYDNHFSRHERDCLIKLAQTIPKRAVTNGKESKKSRRITFNFESSQVACYFFAEIDFKRRRFVLVPTQDFRLCHFLFL